MGYTKHSKRNTFYYNKLSTSSRMQLQSTTPKVCIPLKQKQRSMSQEFGCTVKFDKIVLIPQVSTTLSLRNPIASGSDISPCPFTFSLNFCRSCQSLEESHITWFHTRSQSDTFSTDIIWVRCAARGEDPRNQSFRRRGGRPSAVFAAFATFVTSAAFGAFASSLKSHRPRVTVATHPNF